MLLVDGYNVIYATPRYLELADEPRADSLDHDPFFRAREVLVGDVAAFAQGRFDPVIVYDGAGNLDPERLDLSRAGVRLVFSRTGESADSVIEGMATRERATGRKVTVITSDLAVQATVRGDGVTRLSSASLVHEVETSIEDSAEELADRSHGRMTLADRLSPEALDKLDKLRGRR
jgi:predicted RNA-binding protein with PIN domain